MYKNQSIAIKVTAAATAYCLALGLVVGVVLYQRVTVLADQALKTQTSAYIDPLLEAVKTPLFSGDTISLQVLLERVVDESPVVSASYYSVDNRLTAQGKQPLIPTRDELQTITHPIVLEQSLAGRLVIEIHREAILAPHKQPFYLFLFGWAIFSVALIWASYRFPR